MDEILKKIENFRAEKIAHNKAILDTPRFAFAHVCEVAGIRPARLRNWLSRNAITTSSNEHEQGKWRYFSGTDALRIAAVQKFAAWGLSLDLADVLATVAVDYTRRLLDGGPMSAPPGGCFFVHMDRNGQPHVEGPFRNPDIASLEADIGFFFHPIELCAGVLEELGIGVGIGTAKELREKAGEMEQASDD